MIKFFYAVGDSFVWGHELHEDGPESDEGTELSLFSPYRRKHCYTGIMSDQLEIAFYQNSGQPGGSNERSYRMLINDLSEALLIYKPEEIFVNVGLTHVIRREFCVGNHLSSYYQFNVRGPDSEKNLKNYQLWQLLVKDFNYDYGNFTFNIMIVLGIQNFLRIKKIPYLITSSLPLEILKQKSVISPQLLEQIVKNRYLINPSFNEFAMSNQYKTGPRSHPLEEAHAAWGSKLVKYIKTFNLLDNTDL
jgi:hypothetical protein